MNKFVRNLLTEWRKLGLPFEDATFIVAVSGGADSVSLMLAIDDLRKRKKFKNRFIIAHFNHDLRAVESEQDSEFVKIIAEKYQFEFAVGKGIISKKGNLEQNARFARYQFLLKTARNNEAFGILTAHTINDQAETFLLNLIRGSGIDGLSAMHAILSDFKLKSTDISTDINSLLRVALVRPLLNWARREDTELFCHENKIEFRLDSMNDDLNYRRVRIRKKLLPMLKEINPKIIETLSATSKLLQREKADLILPGNQRPVCDKEFLKLSDLIKLPKNMLYGLLRDWIKSNRGSLRQIESKHIEAVEKLILSRKSGRAVEITNGGIVLRQNGKLFWKQKVIENSDETA